MTDFFSGQWALPLEPECDCQTSPEKDQKSKTDPVPMCTADIDTTTPELDYGDSGPPVEHEVRQLPGSESSFRMAEVGTSHNRSQATQQATYLPSTGVDWMLADGRQCGRDGR